MKALTATLALALAMLATTGSGVSAAPAVLGVSSAPAVLAAAPHHGFSLTVEGFYILDFIILVVVLWAVLKGPVKKYLLKRHEHVLHELETATRLRQEAEVKLAELDKMMAGLESEIAGIREQFRVDGEREKARILAQAAVSAEKIRDNAKKTLAQEMAKLREQLQRELVSSVLEATEARVRQKLDQATQKKLATSYLDAIDQLAPHKAA